MLRLLPCFCFFFFFYFVRFLPLSPTAGPPNLAAILKDVVAPWHRRQTNNQTQSLLSGVCLLRRHPRPPTPPLPFQKLSTTQDLIVQLLIYISKRYIVLRKFSDKLRATLGITGREVSEKDSGWGWRRWGRVGWVLCSSLWWRNPPTWTKQAAAECICRYECAILWGHNYKN